ncbi:hypothetical protein LJC29_07095, partial [Bacteroides sp. OttesenSCG-928-N06]|nr:hypothetical protein [Bacteroides sp. OttesenSCG-928-N06]
MDMYLLGVINASAFCNDFYYSYDLGVDDENLTSIEKIIFAELSSVVDRFSAFEEDFIEYPGVYFTEKELKQKITDAKK